MRGGEAVQRAEGRTEECEWRRVVAQGADGIQEADWQRKGHGLRDVCALVAAQPATSAGNGVRRAKEGAGGAHRSFMGVKLAVDLRINRGRGLCARLGCRRRVDGRPGRFLWTGGGVGMSGRKPRSATRAQKQWIVSPVCECSRGIMRGETSRGCTSARLGSRLGKAPVARRTAAMQFCTKDATRPRSRSAGQWRHARHTVCIERPPGTRSDA